MPSKPRYTRNGGTIPEHARVSYNCCGLCGHQPRTRDEEPNWAPIRWWDPDDGWKVTTLCGGCIEETEVRKPREGDFAMRTTNGVADDVNTDEDPAAAFQ